MILYLFLLSLLPVNDSDEAVILDVPDNMGFEVPVDHGEVPFNWVCDGSASYECTIYQHYHRTGRYSANLHSNYSVRVPYEESFELLEGYLERVIPFRYRGDIVTLSGYFNLDPDWDVTYAGMYMILFDAEGTPVNYNRVIFEDFSPDSEWSFFSVELENSIFADSLDFGVILGGPGGLLIDDMELTIDGLPLYQIPHREEIGALLDHEFDSGSMIEFGQLSSFKKSLELLGKTWVFLKYYYPTICSTEVSRDYELFRTLPTVSPTTP